MPEGLENLRPMKSDIASLFRSVSIAAAGLALFLTGCGGSANIPPRTSIGPIPAGLITEFAQGISAHATPFYIAKGPDGNLWFTEPDVNHIGRITPSGAVTEFGAGTSRRMHSPSTYPRALTATFGSPIPATTASDESRRAGASPSSRPASRRKQGSTTLPRVPTATSGLPRLPTIASGASRQAERSPNSQPVSVRTRTLTASHRAPTATSGLPNPAPIASGASRRADR